MNRIDTVAVTGASSGIGHDIARGFYEQGANLILNGRDKKKLARAANALGVRLIIIYPNCAGFLFVFKA